MEAISGALILHRGREKPLLNRHPWLFSGSIAQVQGAPAPGDLVLINDHRRRYLATGYYNPHSQIQARVLTWDANRAIDETFWRERLQRALDGRRALATATESNALRLANAESDGLPGLVVDRYSEYLVMQCLTLGIDRRKEELARHLAELLQPVGILERSDVAVRQKEGLEPQKGMLFGQEPPASLMIQEHGRRFAVDVWQGHKTGFYLDQRRNRAVLGNANRLAGRTVLNVFAYTGGFAVYAATAGAGPITNIDSSVPALQMAEDNVKRNAPSRNDDTYIAGDAFELLRYLVEEAHTFDAIVLDPPRFAQSQGDVKRASRGYKDLNLQALNLLRPGGLLATFSCSGHISRDLFQKILFSAAVDAGREVQILDTLSQAEDHPVLLTFPQSAYLKGFLCRVW